MIFQQNFIGNSSPMQVCVIAVKMRPRRLRVSLRSDTAKKTCHKHVLTYQLAFTVAPVSNGTGVIKADFMKKLSPFFSRHFCFDELCLGVDQLSTGKLFIVLLVQDHNDRSKIHHQLLCQIHNKTDLLQISLMNDGKIEVGVVFGHRLVYAAPICDDSLIEEVFALMKLCFIIFLHITNRAVYIESTRVYICQTKEEENVNPERKGKNRCTALMIAMREHIHYGDILMTDLLMSEM